MQIEYIKAAGVILGLAGTIVLAFRVTKMLEILTMAAKMVDTNMQVEAARSEGRRDVPNIRMFGVTNHIEGVERLGTKLLVVGFGLQILGGACTVLSFFL